MKSYRSPTGCERAGFERITHCQVPLGEVPSEQKGTEVQKNSSQGTGSGHRHKLRHIGNDRQDSPAMAQLRDWLPLQALVANCVPLGKKSDELRVSNLIFSFDSSAKDALEKFAFSCIIHQGSHDTSHRSGLDDVLLPKLIGFGRCVSCDVTRT